MLLALCASSLGAAGCFAPTYPDGQLQCAPVTLQCPEGFNCVANGTTATCYKNGHEPPRPPVHLTMGAGGAIKVSDGMAGDHTTTIAIGVPLSTSAKPAMPTDHTIELGVMRNAVDH
jgi:hypothetical protein